jgi:hypothetical protein
MIYAIVLCAAGLHGQCVGGFTPMGPTFDSPQACLAALPAFLNGKKVSADGRLYATDTTWYECVDDRDELVTSGAAPFKQVPYVLRHCVGAQCEDSSVTSVSEEACAIAKKLAREYDASGRYECVNRDGTSRMGTSQNPPAPSPLPSSQGSRLAHGYGSFICNKFEGCKQIGSTTIYPPTIYPTKASCQFATKLDPSFVPGNSTFWHECRPIDAQLASSSQEKLPQPVQHQTIPSP